MGAPHHRARVFVTAWPHDADAFLPADPYATFDPDMDVWLTGQPDLFARRPCFVTCGRNRASWCPRPSAPFPAAGWMRSRRAVDC